jgi:hypothetical protein
MYTCTHTFMHTWWQTVCNMEVLDSIIMDLSIILYSFLMWLLSYQQYHDFGQMISCYSLLIMFGLVALSSPSEAYTDVMSSTAWTLDSWVLSLTHSMDVCIFLMPHGCRDLVWVDPVCMEFHQMFINDSKTWKIWDLDWIDLSCHIWRRRIIFK